ncbi:hypothetical protein LTR08_001285 [Meristemomyces frigidus]|nr:hypothetical protein LTR08_001285 [Meristemomyces frigidus]
MRYAALATTAAFAATAFAAPAPEAEPGYNSPSKSTTAATLYFPATCTAVLTSVKTSTKYARIATSTTTSTKFETATTTATSTATSTATVSFTETRYPNATSTVFVTRTATDGGVSTTLPVPDQCVSESDSVVIADIFRQLIQDYSTDMALSALTEDFVDWSSAVNIIMNAGAQYPKNITGATFAGRTEFMDGQGSQPKIPFETLNVFYGCDSVSVRWMTTRSANGQAREVAAIPVIGNAILYVVPAEEGSQYNFRIKDIYSEFNTAAWLVNMGVFKPAGAVDYLNSTTGTPSRRSLNYDHFDASLRGAAI